MSDGETAKNPTPRSPVLAWMVKVFDRIAAICMLVAGVQLTILIAIFGWLVFGRYVLNDTPTWVEQLSLILVVWIAFIGGAAGVWRSTHLGVDFLREALPHQPRQFLRWLSEILMGVFGCFMAWQGYVLASGTWARRIPMLGIAEGWRSVPMAICGVLIVVFSIARLLALIEQRGADDTSTNGA